jgi:signal transduction histidine kinase
VSTPLSLRARLLLGAALWTVGLFGLGIVTWHVVLGNREPPIFFHVLFNHTHLFALFCLACLGAGLLQVRRGWSPINQLRARLTRLRDGRERRLEGEYPTEVEPLVGDLNALLDQREQSANRARATAGDLAHGLKTPLAILAQEAERAAAVGQHELAASISQQVERMRRQVEYQLARARADASGQGASAAAVSVHASADGLARTLQRLHAGRGVTIALDDLSDVHVRVAREDLDEMLGNLLDNACKWARRQARVSAARHGEHVAIVVDDDGPGIEASLRTAVLGRGVRADEVAPGSGLGLSIVRDLAAAYGGRVTLEESPLGGLRAVLRLPAGEPLSA